MRLFLLLLLLTSLQAFAEISESADSNRTFRIDEIIVEGNDITEEFIILRELTFDIGDSVDLKTLEFNRERVFSLGLFSNVKFEVNDSLSSNTLNISIKESWYIYPIPFLHIRENSFSKSTYGLNLLYKNFRGRNETIRTIFALGYNPSLMLTYYNPVFIEEEDISLQFDVSYGKFGNLNKRIEAIIGDEQEYSYSSFLVGAGKRINNFVSLFASVGFRYVEPPVQGIDGMLASSSNADRLPVANFHIGFDTRDLAQFPKSGIYSSFNISHQGFGINDAAFSVLIWDFRNYYNLFEDLIFKWRAKIRNTFGGKIPVYEYSYLGHGEFVRGHRQYNYEGNNYLLSSVEFNYPLLKEWNFSIKLPYIPERITRARIGIYLGVFSDMATVYNNDEKFLDKQFHKGYGSGLSILFLPYNVIRFEYAFDENNNGEFILESGFSF